MKNILVVVKLAFPDGWVFDKNEISIEIDGENDVCSQNGLLEFNFQGLVYSGSIVSEGGQEGPAGVKVKIYRFYCNSCLLTISYYRWAAYKAGHFIACKITQLSIWVR